jgi:hypothetical protein
MAFFNQKSGTDENLEPGNFCKIVPTYLHNVDLIGFLRFTAGQKRIKKPHAIALPRRPICPQGG